jgi:ribosomal protein S18 acetylase RimI-like enzyme
MDEAALGEVRRSLEREFEELDDNRFIYIAWEGDLPVGALQLVLKSADNDPELADGFRVAHVHHLRVHHDKRRIGIGRQLMAHLENEARARAFAVLTLGVDVWNDAAKTFYAKLGYELFKNDDLCDYLKLDLGSGRPRFERA